MNDEGLGDLIEALRKQADDAEQRADHTARIWRESDAHPNSNAYREVKDAMSMALGYHHASLDALSKATGESIDERMLAAMARWFHR